MYIGMRVRLTDKLDRKRKLVQNAVGRVVDIEWHDDEFRDKRNDWVNDPKHAAFTRGQRLKSLSFPKSGF